MTNIAMENPLYMEVVMGNSSINGSFSRAMLVITPVTVMGIIHYKPTYNCTLLAAEFGGSWRFGEATGISGGWTSGRLIGD